MKRVFVIALTAIILASCTFKSAIVSNRTPDNLTSLHVDLLNSSINAVALVLSDIDIQYKDTILTAGFDTLITSEAFYNRFGSSICEMDITRSADSAWTVSSTGTGMLAFTGAIRMTGRNEEKYPVFTSNYNGIYDEGDGFTAEFNSSKLDFTLRTSQEYVEGYGIVTRLKLNCYGNAIMKTYLDSAPLDNVTTTFDGGKISN